MVRSLLYQKLYVSFLEFTNSFRTSVRTQSGTDLVSYIQKKIIIYLSKHLQSAHGLNWRIYLPLVFSRYVLISLFPSILHPCNLGKLYVTKYFHKIVAIFPVSWCICLNLESAYIYMCAGFGCYNTKCAHQLHIHSVLETKWLNLLFPKY